MPLKIPRVLCQELVLFFQVEHGCEGELFKAARSVLLNPQDPELNENFKTIHTDWMKNLEELRVHVENTLEPERYIKACGKHVSPHLLLISPHHDV